MTAKQLMKYLKTKVNGVRLRTQVAAQMLCFTVCFIKYSTDSNINSFDLFNLSGEMSLAAGLLLVVVSGIVSIVLLCLVLIFSLTILLTVITRIVNNVTHHAALIGEEVVLFGEEHTEQLNIKKDKLEKNERNIGLKYSILTI